MNYIKGYLSTWGGYSKGESPELQHKRLMWKKISLDNQRESCENEARQIIKEATKQLESGNSQFDYTCWMKTKSFQIKCITDFIPESRGITMETGKTENKLKIKIDPEKNPYMVAKQDAFCMEKKQDLCKDLGNLNQMNAHNLHLIKNVIYSGIIQSN